MKSIAFLTTDWNKSKNPPEPNGCAYYRMHLPSVELDKLGFDVGFGMPAEHPERGIGLAVEGGGLFGWDVLVLKLLMHETIPDLMTMMQQNGSRFVVDVDDFHFGIPEQNVASQITDPRRNSEHNRMIYEMIIRRANSVTVSTNFLADFYGARCRDVRLVRNSIDVERFVPVSQPELPIFGWVGATPWRAGDVEVLREWLPSFVKDKSVEVHHSGHLPGDPNHFAVRAGLSRVSTTMMAAMSDYPRLLTHFHVGLVPLTRNPFNESKSFLKGLEYAAAGIPFIATPTEEYRILYNTYRVGRLAETPDEWRDHATELLDPGVRREEADRQRNIVIEHFNIATKGREWATAILS